MFYYMYLDCRQFITTLFSDEIGYHHFIWNFTIEGENILKKRFIKNKRYMWEWVEANKGKIFAEMV